MRKLNLKSFYLMIMLLFPFYACNKIEEPDVMKDNLVTDDEVAAWFDEILNETDDLTMVNETKNNEITMIGASGTRSFVKSVSGDTIIRRVTYSDFVHPNSPGERIKNGTIIIQVLGRPHLEKFWRKVTLVDFFVNDNKVEGIKVSEKKGDFKFTATLVNGKITFGNGDTYTREFTRTRTQTAGTQTPFLIWDDEFSVEGEASGVNRAGKNYTHTVTEPLILRRNCRWLVKGVVEFEVDAKTALLDYGDGTCDRFATLTMNGESTIITLGRQR